ncbi:hypothetical protein [Phenylobacterium sp.]|jgi:hypothetical protein|uniref:hypothetical protein n=1 Tax=Phenylobacterium sp. TaxID=1871053 RepID=UPI002F42A4FE
MTIPAEEAASALKDAEAAAGRSARARGYQSGSGYLLVWGAVWTLANIAAQISERAGELAWTGLVILGVVASMVMGRRFGSGVAGGPVKALLVAAAIGGFGLCVQVVAPPLGLAQANALASLAVGAVYIALGSAGGLRLSAVGAVVMAATVVGWLFLRDWFFLWSAVVGGGGLILGGLWFRKA